MIRTLAVIVTALVAVVVADFLAAARELRAMPSGVRWE